LSRAYDVVVVGARVAGASLGYLLAREGHRVLLVDRATFPSDVPHSTLLIHQPGVAFLRKWGLEPRILATGCPKIKTWQVHLGPMVFRGSPPPAGEIDYGLAPRRYILDSLIAEAAVEGGADFQQGYTVNELLWDRERVVGLRGTDQRGANVDVAARLVVGADGFHSRVAKAVAPSEYDVHPPLVAACYSYFHNLTLPDGVQFEFHGGVHRAIFAWPTNNDEVILGVNWKAEELEAKRKNPEAEFFAVLDELSPSLAERVRQAKRSADFTAGCVPANYFRKPVGPGWALVGDAGACYEFTTAHGMTNAFRQVDQLAPAISEGLRGDRPIEESLKDFEETRNQFELPFYHFTRDNMTNQPPPEQALQLFGAIHASPRATNQFFGVLAQTVSPGEFFSPENLQAIMSLSG